MSKNKVYIRFLFLLLFAKINFTFGVIRSNNFDNSGRLEGSVQEILVKENLVNSGTIYGTEFVHIECGNLIGDGIIKGSKIEIYAKNFDFKGSIDCDHECTIITPKAINQSQFKKMGKGKFNFKVKEKFELPSNKIVLPTFEKIFEQLTVEQKKNNKIFRLSFRLNYANLTDKNLIEKIRNFLWELELFLQIKYKTSQDSSLDLFKILCSIDWYAFQANKEVSVKIDKHLVDFENYLNVKNLEESTENLYPITLFFVVLFDKNLAISDNYVNNDPRVINFPFEIMDEAFEKKDQSFRFLFMSYNADQIQQVQSIRFII